MEIAGMIVNFAAISGADVLVAWQCMLELHGSQRALYSPQQSIEKMLYGSLIFQCVYAL